MKDVHPFCEVLGLMNLPLSTLKAGLVFFWSVWLTIVFLTNLFDGLKQLGILPPGWRFASQNFQLIQKATEGYSSPSWLAGLLFLGVVIWQGASGILLWIAWGMLLAHGSAALAAVDTAFTVLLALWAAFMVADEIFRVYEQQSSHLMIFVAQLATLLALHLL